MSGKIAVFAGRALSELKLANRQCRDVERLRLADKSHGYPNTNRKMSRIG